MSASLTIFFVIEPPGYQYMACHLAASIRMHMSHDVVLIGYCPRDKLDDLDRNAVEVLRRLRCQIRPIDTAGQFDPPYPHGNKLLAALDPKETDFAAFMDSDMLMIRDCNISEITQSGAIGMSPSTSMRWGPQTVWDQIYGHFGMPVPEERIEFTRDKRIQAVPYFNAGLIVMDERHRSPDGKRFAEVWMDSAKSLDGMEGLDNKRPYLDQMTLPIATLRAGMRWNILPERYNYSMGGIMRGQPLPEDQDITVLHYRRWKILEESGWRDHARKVLAQEVGTRRINWVGMNKPKNGISELPEGTDPLPITMQPPQPRDAIAQDATQPSAPPATVARGGRPDASKATMAAVTMVYQDHFFLERWVRYYSAQIGRENLYILRHGTDPEIDRIAEGANIIHIPQMPDKSRLERQRWGLMSQFASGLTLYYNWVIANDVDEIIALDPMIGTSLPEYLNNKFLAGAPQFISPFAVEIIHTPASETDPILPDRPILERRRNFRINSNYAKPCIIRGRIRFSIGGHGSNMENVELDPNLFLFHLRYVDDGISRKRLEARRQLEASRATDGTERDGTWAKSLAAYETLCAGQPVAEQALFPEINEIMVSGRTQAHTGNWFFKTYRSKDLYRLPERFGPLF